MPKTFATSKTDTSSLAPKASPTFTGTVTIPTPFTLGAVSVLPTGTELNFVDGVTSNIQTQLDSKATGTIPVKASGAELDTGTDDAKFATAAALVASHDVPSVTPGTSGNILTSNGTDWTSASKAGMVVQIVNYQTGAVASGTTAIPFDDTIPQNTEGDERMTLAITPKSATNKLKIDVVANVATSINGYFIGGALFQDATAGALAAVMTSTGSLDHPTQIVFTHFMTSGTTSATTFKVRIGTHYSAPTTVTFNGNAAARKFGGVCASSITITEIVA